MQGLSPRSLRITVVFAIINIIGLTWIHHDLTRSPRATVRILAASLLPDADSADRIALTFDREMIAQDAVGRMVKADVFSLAPACPGQWVWAARNRLEYLLNKPLPAGRVMRLAATARFEGVTGRSLEGKNEFQFEARPLRVVSHAVLASGQREFTLQVTFNQPVEPGEFLRQTRFADGRTLTPLEEPIPLTSAPQKELVIRLRRPQSNQLRMEISERLTGYGGEVGLGRPAVIRVSLVRGFGLLQASLNRYGSRLTESVPVRLHFSRPLGFTQPLPKLVIEPAVERLSVQLLQSTIVATGKFKAGARYTIRVPGTLLSRDGETLGQDASATVDVPDYYPAIQFEQHTGILSPGGRLGLDAKAVNVTEIGLRAWRVHANNLVHHLHRTNTAETSKSVLDKILPLDITHNQPGKFVLGLEELLSRPLGIYRVEARATNRRWTRDAAIVTVTDLAITAKRQRNGYLVWVTSLQTAEPVANVTIQGLTYNNQTVATATTDAEGIAQLRFAGNHADGAIWVIMAARNGDLSYLQPDDNRWVIDDIKREGRPYSEHYETLLYTDRGVYRPGETVHLTGVIRDRIGAVPPAFPLSLKIVRPDGRRVVERTLQRHEKDQGMFHASFAPSAEAQTGRYEFRITLPGSEDSLGATHALVEAFVPVRMEVTAAATAERFGPNEPPVLDVTGRYLWDQPAAALPVCVEGTLRVRRYRSTACPEFHFGMNRREAPIPLAMIKGELDERGQSEVSLHLPKDLKSEHYQMRLSATVTEPGGRSVSSTTAATLDLWDRHIGLRLPKGNVVPAGEAIAVDWVRLTGGDQPARGGELTLQLLRVEYDTVLKRVDKRRVWQSVKRTVQIGSDQMITSAYSEGSAEVVCPVSGAYRVVVIDSASGSSTCLDFHASRQGESAQNLAMNQPERVEVITDQAQYAPGAVVKVLLRSAIPGKVLLTLETDRVIGYHITRIAENSCTLDVALPAEVRGGVFLTATVIRPVDPNEESWLPHRGMGSAQVRIDHAWQKMPVTLSAPAKTLPGDTVTVTVDAGPSSDPNLPARVQVWAVDEGILLAGAYKTPDLHAFFLGPRALGVATADVFYSLLPDYKRPEGMSRIGGDDYALDALRRSPVPMRTREPAVVWQEAIAVDAEGKGRIQMRLPDLTGQLRIMAVAADQDRYGAAEHDLTLAAPLMMEASWPRFAAPGDAFTVPVKLINAADRPLHVEINADVSGPIEVSRVEPQRDLVVESDRPLTCFLQVKAAAMGPVEVNLEAVEQGASAAPLTARNRALLAVRPATALHTAVVLMAVTAGEQVQLEPPDQFMKETVRMTVSVNARPSVNLAAALEELIRYPYGCVEQTSSQLFSLLYAPQILDTARAKTIDAMVEAGIARLWSMQTRSGGLSYWPGRLSASLWGTAYAASCLLEARNAGYEIDPRFTSELAKFLGSRLRATGDKGPATGTQALICRVLATFGDPPHGWMARLSEQKDQLDAAALAHLASAFHAVGNRQRALSLVPDNPLLASVATTTTGRLTSEVQQQAVLLSALLEIDPNHVMVNPLVTNLDKARSNGQWGTTLNNAATIAALARYQTLTSGDPAEYSGQIQAGTDDALPFTQEESVSLEVGNAGDSVRISSQGQGKFYVAAMSRGLVQEDRVESYDRGLHIERQWLDRDGEPVDTNSLAVGDLVQVEIVVRTKGDTVHNIAIVDALPGGLEVENPRLATSVQTNLSVDERPDHVEFLDDRVVLFCTAGSKPKTYRYALRAITAGEFSLPPIQGSCMYDPAVACLGTAGHVTVRAQ